MAALRSGGSAQFGPLVSFAQDLVQAGGHVVRPGGRTIVPLQVFTWDPVPAQQRTGRAGIADKVVRKRKQSKDLVEINIQKGHPAIRGLSEQELLVVIRGQFHLQAACSSSAHYKQPGFHIVLCKLMREIKHPEHTHKSTGTACPRTWHTR